MRALTIGVLLSVVGLAAIASAEHSPKLYPDSEEFLSGGGTIPGDLTVQSSDAGSAGDPQLTLDRNSASPANADVLGQFIWLGNDSGGADQQYGRCEAVITDVTAGNEDGRLDFYATIAGSPALVCSMDTSVTLYKGIVSSGVTTDVTTGTDEALTLAPNGTGDLVADTDLMSVCDGACPAWAGAGTGLGVEGAIEAQGAQSWGGDATFVAGATLSTTTNGSLTVDPDGGGDLNVTLDSAAGSTFTLQSFNAASTAGPTMQQYYADGTPTAEDVIALMNWVGQDSALNDQTYGYIQGIDVDPTSTSEDFRLETWASIAGTVKKVAEVGMTTQGAGMSLPFADDGALGPTLGFAHNSASPLAADVTGRIIFAGKDSGAADQEYNRIESVMVDPTAAGEDGRLDVKPFVAGAQNTLASVGAILDYAGALAPGIALQNGEYVRNNDNGDICFGANGGTNPEELCLDLDYGSNVATFKTGGSGINSVRYALGTTWNDNLYAEFGTKSGLSAGDFAIGFDSTNQDPDAPVFALSGGATNSTALFLIEYGDAADFSASLGDQTNPTLVIQNADATAPTKRIWLQHDGTDGKIEVGSGGLKAASPTLTASAATGEYGWVFDQTLNAAAGTNDGGITTEVYNGVKINLTTTDTAGWDAVYALSVYDDNVRKFSVTPTGGVSASSTISGNDLFATTTVTAGAASYFNWNGRSRMYSEADGQIRLTNAAGTDFDDLVFGVDASATFGELHLTDGAVPELRWRQSDGSGAANFAVEGDFVLPDMGTTVDSGKLYMISDQGGTAATASLYNVHGADPYIRISAPSDAGAETPTLDIHDTAISYGNGVAGVDYKIDWNGESNDGTLTYMEDEDRFDFDTTAQAPTFQSTAADPADSGIVRLGNAESICWESSPAGTDYCVSLNSSEEIAFTAAVGAPKLLVGNNSNVAIGASDAAMFQWDTAETQPALKLGFLSTTSKNLILCETADIDVNFGRAASSDPSIYLQSSDANDPQQYSRVTWDHLEYTVDTLGAKTTAHGAYETLTCAGGGGSATLTTTGLIPDGAVLHGITTRITTALTGATGYTVGDGSDADIFGVEATATQGATTDNSDVTAHWGNPQLAAGEVTITFSGANCTAGAVHVVAHYTTVTAPSVNALTP